MEPLIGKSENDLIDLVVGLGESSYRGKQIYRAIHHNRILDLSSISELSTAFRERLASICRITDVEIADVFKSTDGTRRYLLRLADGKEVEAVFIPEERRDTICISCQVGCAVGCTFCMTAQVANRRNMSASEITAQVIIVLNEVYGTGNAPPHGINLVFMGMGESFLNYREVMKSVRVMADAKGLAISPKRMTISTSGIVPKIADLAREAVRPNLAISLSATTDDLRDELVPINRKYPLESLFKACRDYPLGDRERLTFEYVMLDRINDSDDDATRLVKLLRGIKAKVNLIPHNPAPELPYSSSSPERIASFQEILVKNGVPAFIRRPRGQDISAACGQLAARHAS